MPSSVPSALLAWKAQLGEKKDDIQDDEGEYQSHNLSFGSLRENRNEQKDNVAAFQYLRKYFQYFIKKMERDYNGM